MTKRVVDALAIQCCTTLTQAMVDAHPEEFPESIVQVLAKHPKLDYQIKVAKGMLCEDTAIEIIKGDGVSVVVQLKDTGNDNVNFFISLLQEIASRPAPLKPLDEPIGCLEFADRVEFRDHFLGEFGYPQLLPDGSTIDRSCMEVHAIQQIINDWGPNLIDDKLTVQERDRYENWKNFDASEEGQTGYYDPDFIDCLHPACVHAIYEQFDGNEKTGTNRFGTEWFNSLVEFANAKALVGAWVPTPIQRFKFGWL